MNSYTYTNFRRNMGQKVNNLTTDTLKVALLTTSYTPNLDSDCAYSMSAPAAPSPTNIGTGGSVPAGVYGVIISYVNPAGETVCSTAGTTTTTGTTSTLTVPSPSASSPVDSCTGWYAYVTQAGGGTYYRQQTAGSPTAIGTNLTLTANPTTSGATATAGTLASGANPASIAQTSGNEVAGASGYTTGGFNLSSPGPVTWLEVLANNFTRSWVASTAYSLGQIVRPASGNGYLYQCVAAGSSGSGTPTWGTTIGGLTTDGTVTWLNIATSLMVLAGPNVTWTMTAAITWRYAVVYDATTGDLLCYVDPGGTQTGPSNGTININWDTAGGILKY